MLDDRDKNEIFAKETSTVRPDRETNMRRVLGYNARTIVNCSGPEGGSRKRGSQPGTPDTLSIVGSPPPHFPVASTPSCSHSETPSPYSSF